MNLRRPLSEYAIFEPLIHMDALEAQRCLDNSFPCKVQHPIQLERHAIHGIPHLHRDGARVFLFMECKGVALRLFVEG